ncbi:hypothetical protein CKO15_02720 [Halorhodospira abdelmalekii]|uniref:c-type cytochrome n=1 Tax=Halorhodospira abdelmalekii TaxID=421629 RepID=UPI001906A204|nr:c-type cytochrome [Halorhodospira abdelmalekii]MBK1734212.1 hypothetical protein [Halorhodospira abdelmalekii]
MYHRTQIFAMAAILALGIGVASADEVDIGAGERLHQESCAACHGGSGVSEVPGWPSVAGQQADYTRHHLRLFRDEERYDPQGLMTPESLGLSDADIRNLAAYYAQLNPPPAQEVDEELAERGRQIYFAGVRDRNVTSCTGCHGPRGQGVQGALYPLVAGQDQTYTVEALKGYQSGERTSDRNSEMRDIAKRMTAEDIEAVAAFLASMDAAKK